MRFCPTCQTRYDEEILRFCTKDGTPLVEENQPNFTELPSESGADDFGDETVIRRNLPKSTAPPVENIKGETKPPRIVIPTTGKINEPQVRVKATASYRQPPPQSNTGKVVLLTVLGTLIALMASGIVYLFLSRESSGDSNQNKITNANFNPIDMNLNANLSGGSSAANFNFNTGANINVNTNANLNLNTNANVKPTPTKAPTPKPTATPNTNANANSNSGNSNITAPPTPRPTVAPTPSASPKPSPTNVPPANRPVNAGVLNGRALNLPKPAYPPIARQMRASGQVAVLVSVDEGGNVTAAKATSGNTLLRAPAEAAARQSRLNPIIVGDRAVKATGFLVYNFINQ